MTVVRPKRNQPIKMRRKNMQPALSAGKLATTAKRGKTRVSQITTGFRLAPDWFNNLTRSLIG